MAAASAAWTEFLTVAKTAVQMAVMWVASMAEMWVVKKVGCSAARMAVD